MPDLIGRKLGKYEVIERLGRGGMAEVYKAYQSGIERHVAIKVLHSHLSDNPDFVQRFQQEARSIGQLQHTHSGRVIDFDVEGGVYYMVMEYLQGGALDHHLKQKGILPVDEAVEITRQLASALAYAHQLGVIHRDIKPSNVLFSDESHDHALLTDFGLACLLHEQKQFTLTGSLVGTPNYMSPEAALSEPCDARSDIYSLGVVLYEMVTGRTPYAADTPYTFLMKQANEPLPSPRTLNPRLPVALESVLLKALAKAPTERYQSAAEFALALQAMPTSEQVTIASKSPKPQSATQPKRARPSLALASIGVVIVAILTSFVLLQLDTGVPATPRVASVTTNGVAVGAAPTEALIATPTATSFAGVTTSVAPADVAIVALPTVTPTPSNTPLSNTPPTLPPPLPPPSPTAVITITNAATPALLSMPPLPLPTRPPPPPEFGGRRRRQR